MDLQTTYYIWFVAKLEFEILVTFIVNIVK